ncbi:hypothetical protein SAMN05216353_11132 [Halobacillus alkaliphilus]|uniref:Uncharacterized protein n=1 Tax=Halobacillus alkaliphilus TaxID=396056 RepID=A0A1I2M2S6_9BACI|nr:hypothetical protein [Halobacillus alkaliphilus]SFF85814.1 hypothetical protein SAMN05216353_11132 [Halobacillus alkaliphilus]
MAKRTKKNDPEQKHKNGFDPKKADTEFAEGFGSAEANRIHKEEAKQARKSHRPNQAN